MSRSAWLCSVQPPASGSRHRTRRGPLALCLVLGVGCGSHSTGPSTDGAPPDLASDAPDADARDLTVTDLASSQPDLAPTEGVGPRGGSIQLLRFGFTGDTRPAACDDTGGYPSAIIGSIFNRMRAADVQFALDLGDHVFVCQGDLSVANAQMNLYMQAARKLGKTLFMTMGNHECSDSAVCIAGALEKPQFQAYMAALAPISALPYYSVDVQTSLGLARFVFVADNSWSDTQKTWLEATLADADTRARYTFVMRHHPLGDSDFSLSSTIEAVIRAHKYTLLLTGHSHTFRVDTDHDPSGRAFVIGTGGAPLRSGSTWYGYGIVEQQPDGDLALRVYDEASGVQMYATTITPQ